MLLSILTEQRKCSAEWDSINPLHANQSRGVKCCFHHINDSTSRMGRTNRNSRPPNFIPIVFLFNSSTVHRMYSRWTASWQYHFLLYNIVIVTGSLRISIRNRDSEPTHPVRLWRPGSEVGLVTVGDRLSTRGSFAEISKAQGLVSR